MHLWYTIDIDLSAGGLMSQSISEGTYSTILSIKSQDNKERSLRRVPHWQNAAGSYHECHHAATARIRRGVGKSKFGYPLYS